MTTFAITIAANKFISNNDGSVRTWTKKNSAQKFRSTQNIRGTVEAYVAPAAVTVTDSVSAMLRAAAASFAKEDRSAYMEAVKDSGVTVSLARRQFRKVHGSMFA